ncbi:sulfotransferase, partial [Streptosporangium sandarakinum]
MESDRPIFIVGCPRSGTTLLQLMTHAHHRIA